MEIEGRVLDAVFSHQNDNTAAVVIVIPYRTQNMNRLSDAKIIINNNKADTIPNISLLYQQNHK